ncbi:MULTISPECIES: IclR family transcriptional regulator [unclassified Nocardioides]|uniref:IclR family transcriptional regulator n=1 Tax=unclassified Nocardioides TaxID=2615069 RepID=UPI0006F85579|nr:MULTISPECIES: IclR family transcriptional regulator [unclassified Nocardioides]KRA29519.1 IclR family transcriptional regulator [Nocardioides sp. Root614]KRA88306.1 IclR family transcriptional regulator [Nocardioides sp. Root682]
MSALTIERTETTQERELPPSMVERMTLILDLFTTRESRETLEQIVRTTGLPRSTAHRILDQLVRLEWLEHSAQGYGLGRRSLVLGGGAEDHSDLRSAASPYLHDLLIRTGAVIHLAVLEGDQVRYLDKIGGRFAATVPSRVGGTAPAHCTGLGKAMLAWLEPEYVDELVGEQIPARTPATISEVDALHRELGRIRGRNGLALERGECFPDIACAAAAIRGPRGPVGAISVVAAAGTALERVAPLVVDAVRRIAADLYPDLPEQVATRSSRAATVTRIRTAG